MNKILSRFTNQFATYRQQAGLSYRALEAKIGIKASTLAAMQTGHRPVGEQSARRIASALGLSGEALEGFVLGALNTSRERVLEAVKEYPSEVLNLLGLLLLGHGIKPGHILDCTLDAFNAQSDQQGLVLTLSRSRTVRLEVTLR